MPRSGRSTGGLLLLSLPLLWSCGDPPGRTVLPRFSNSGSHRECVDEHRGLCAAGRESRDAAAVAPRLREIGGLDGHDRLVRLLTELPDPRTVETIADGLEERAGASPNAVILSDLAAAEYLRARLAGRSQRLLAALELGQRAISASPGSSPALFNQALVAEALGLIDVARGAWRAAIEAEGDDGWREEARSRLVALDGPVGAATGDPDARERPACSGDSPHQQLLDDLERLAGGQAPDLALSGQRLAGCLPAVRNSALATEAEVLARRLALGETRGRRLDGVRRYLEALAALRSNDPRAARQLLDQSVALLASEGSPLGGWLALLQASVDFYEQRTTDAVARAEALLAARPQDPWLRYRAHWVAGVAHGRLGALSRSYRHYSDSLAAAGALGETADRAALSARTAEVLQLLGYRRRAWDRRLEALVTLAAFEHHPNRVSALWEAGLAASQEDRSALASAFLAEAAAAVAPLASDIRLPQIASLRAEVLAALGSPAAATASLETARTAIDAMPPGAIRDRAQALTDEAAAAVWLEGGRPEAAASALAPLILDARERRLDVDLLRLYGRRATAARRLGDAAAEETDLRAVVATALGIRQRVDAPIFDHAFSASVEASFARLVFLTASAGRDPAAALGIFDSSRAFRNHQPPVARHDFARPASRLPGRTAIVGYSLHEEELLGWFLDRAGLRFRTTRVPAPLVAELTRDAGGPPAPEMLERLYGLLVAPWAEPLAGVERLLVLPDRHLAGVPFASLKAPGESKALVSRFEIGILPRLFGPPREAFRLSERRAVVVGAAAAPGPPFEHLGALPRVDDEVDRVRSAYGAERSQVVVARDLDTIRSALEAASVFHFAGHAIAHPEDPLIGYLLLALPDGQGQISGQELGRWRLEALEVAVLSACSTIESRANGFVPLSVPLLEAGAGAVIGNLWPVDDRAAGEFAAALHQRLAAGEGVLAALRGAQLALMDKRPGDPSWAGWQALVAPPFSKTAG